MLKQSRTLSAIAASSLLAAFAAHANKGAEYHPHKHHDGHKFFITGGATYLEPSLNGLDYLDIAAVSTTGVNPDVNTYVVQPEFNWGYFVAAGYKISHHYDIQANWAQFDSSLSDSTSAAGSAALVTNTTTSNKEIFLPLGAGDTLFANSKQSINYSVFDASLGQYHDITEMLKARLFAGVRWAKVDATINNVYDYSAFGVPIYDDYSSSFNGAGPEVGVDLEYKVWEQLGVVSHLAAAFLIGQQETSSYVFNDGGQASVNADSVARVVPGFDMTLGLNWAVPYHHDQFAFAVEAGYQVAYYFDVIDEVQFISVGGPSYFGDTEHNYSNYGMMGPYLNLTAMF